MSKRKGLKMLFERLDTDKIVKEAIANSERVRFAVQEAGITSDEIGTIITDGGEIVETYMAGSPVVIWIDGRSGTAEKVMIAL
jgi:SpoVK/Ycf46/Vps4 family AAA+-type ATPase